MGLSAETKLGHYEILAPLGAGGMGEVYRAKDTRLDREVALKVLPPSTATDAMARARLLREARLASKLNHPNVCTIHEVGEADGQAYIAMELVEGETLSARLSGGALSLDLVARYGEQVAEALSHAHGHGVVHRDLKSANIVLTPEGRAKVLDFGLAKRLVTGDAAEATTLSQASLTEAGTVTGTLAYMAPEQLRGQPADARTDLWALGVVLYEMATGRLPFPEKLPSALIDDIIHEAPPPPGRLRRDLSPQMEQAILRCLEKQPANRYASARELLAEMKRIAAPEAFSAARPAAAPSRRSVTVGAVLALVLLVLAAAGYFAWRGRFWPARPRDGRVMLAVLPVENLDQDPAQEYFSDGLTEEMIAQLGRLQPRRLGVTARTSAMHYKRTQKPVDQIGRELGVDYLLESSVRHEAARVRITVQLIQVRDQTHLWAETFEREMEGIFAIQSEIAERVARSLAVELLPAERARLAEARSPKPEAHVLYLKARHHWNRRTPGDLLKATELFGAATGVDPDFALAWAGLADSYALYSHYGVLAPKAAFPQARAAADRALALDPTLVEAETTLAFVSFYYDWDWVGAERRLKQILDRQPDYAIARQWHAEYLSAMGWHDAALREIRRALESDPLSPVIRVMEAYVDLFARRYGESLEVCRRVHPLEPDHALAFFLEGRTYAAMGRYPEALDAYRRAGELSGEGGLSRPEIAEVTARLGKRDEARRMLEQMNGPAWAGQRPNPASLAAVHGALGEIDEAMGLLETAFQERDVLLVRVKVDPRFDPMRRDARFQELVRRMFFPAKEPDA
jgi:serine/threonine-protein kinase